MNATDNNNTPQDVNRLGLLIGVNIGLVLFFAVLVIVFIKIRYFSKSSQESKNPSNPNRAAYSTWNRVFNSGTRIWRTTKDVDSRETDIANTISHKNSKAYILSKVPPESANNAEPKNKNEKAQRDTSKVDNDSEPIEITLGHIYETLDTRYQKDNGKDTLNDQEKGGRLQFKQGHILDPHMNVQQADASI